MALMSLSREIREVPKDDFIKNIGAAVDSGVLTEAEAMRMRQHEEFDLLRVADTHTINIYRLMHAELEITFAEAERRNLFEPGEKEAIESYPTVLEKHQASISLRNRLGLTAEEWDKRLKAYD